jgi:ABC-type nitrate/sulfonate/bicarbonate transport system substrate-binding protein
MNSRTKLIGIAAIGGGAMMVLVWFLLPATTEPTRTVQLERITVGAEASMLTAAIWVAESRGYFDKEGLDVRIKTFDSGRLSLLAMLKGEGIDICTVAPTPIMFNSFERDDFAIIATFVYSYDDIKVIARKDKGIATARDLKGKKVGTPARTTGQFFLNAFLTDRGVPAKEVQAIDINPSDLPVALEKNDVDAIVIWEPHGYYAQELLGDKATRLPDLDIYKETFNFVVMKDYAATHPELLAKFLRATDAATTFIVENKEEARELVAENLDLDRKVTAAIWDDFVFEMSLDQTLIRTLEEEALWAIRSQLVDRPKIPNYLHYIHLRSLKAVKPQAVTIPK